MPKYKKKVRLIPHAKERILDPTRVSSYINLDKDLLTNALKNRDREVCCFAKATSNTRSIVYTKINNVPLKIVFNRKQNKIITFLPINHCYETNYIIIYHENGNTYRMKLFPDCYYETNNPKMMTEFYIKEGDSWVEMKKTKKIFEDLFQKVWKYYETFKFAETENPEIYFEENFIRGGNMESFSREECSGSTNIGL